MTDIVESLMVAADMQERGLALDAHQREMREGAATIVTLRAEV